MKVYISADMEGATGVTARADVVPGSPSYNRFRRMLTGDVNAAVEGAIEGGATQVLVNEAHGSKRNILLEDLHPGAEMISGRTQPLGMMEGIGEGFDAAFFIGYHAMAGTAAGILNHTFSSAQVYNLSLNGEKIGETGMNSLLAGHFKVPIVMISGDDKLCNEARAFLGNVETAVVKESIDRYVARCLTPGKTTQMIKNAAKKSLENISSYAPVNIDPPLHMEIQFMRTSKAAAASLVPSVERKDSRTVAFTCDSIIDAYNLITVCLAVSKRDDRE